MLNSLELSGRTGPFRGEAASISIPVQYCKMEVPSQNPPEYMSNGAWLKILIMAYILLFQLSYLKNYPHVHVKNIFLALKRKKWQGFQDSKNAIKIY